MMKITMKDIAEMAGVSKSTVSRVINNTKPVSAEIRKRVEKVIEETNYKPSSVARSLAKKETHIIGLIIPDLANDFYTELVRGISEAAHEHGYNVFLCNTFRDHELELDFLEILKEKEVDAIIFTTFHITEEQKEFMRTYKKPIVTVNREFDDESLPLIPNIDIDNYKASYEAVEYLINTGHKRIGIIRASEEDKTCIDRLEAYQKALHDHGLECTSDLIIGKDFHFTSAYDEMYNILNSKERPDAMFCISDELACAAIKACLDFGLRVPEDISIIGFDDIPLAKRYNPEITTVRQPIFDMGKVAMETVYDMITNKEEMIKNIILQHELIIRESTKKRED